MAGTRAGGVDKSARQAFYLKEIAFSTFFTLGSGLQGTDENEGRLHKARQKAQQTAKQAGRQGGRMARWQGLSDTLHAAGAAPGQGRLKVKA